MPDVTLHLGDCLEIMRSMPDRSVDMIFTDPPYGNGNNNNEDLIHAWERAVGKGKLCPPRPIQNDGRDTDEMFRAALREFARLLKPRGVLCCCCGDGGGRRPKFAWWSIWIDEVLCFKQKITWDKGKIGMGWHYRRSTEAILVASRGPNCNWYYKGHDIENIIRPGEHNIRKIIPRAHQHPTEKPPELAMFFIRLHTKPGDIVLDPFMGSGSTGEAALRMGRRFIGIELDPHWYEVARQRLLKQETVPAEEGKIRQLTLAIS